MKKFTRILVCLMLFVFAFSFVACGNNGKDKFVYPASNAKTEGTGSTRLGFNIPVGQDSGIGGMIFIE